MIMYTNGDMVFTDELPKTVMHAFDDLKRGNRREVVVSGWANETTQFLSNRCTEKDIHPMFLKEN